MDFLLSRVDGALFINEINTIPGFTSISMYPKLFAAAGIPYPRITSYNVCYTKLLRDELDILILDTLQRNGRIKRSELAEVVKLSLPATSDRLRKLEDRGYIRGYAAVLDPAKFGKDITAFVQVSVDT